MSTQHVSNWIPDNLPDISDSLLVEFVSCRQAQQAGFRKDGCGGECKTRQDFSER